MSSVIPAAKRHRAVFLATTILAFNAAVAQAQTPPPTDLPPIEISPPTDPNRTRARPLTDEGGGTPRPARTAAPLRGTGTGTSDEAGTGTGEGSGTGGGVRQVKIGRAARRARVESASGGR